MIQSSATIESQLLLALTKRGIFFSVVFQELEFEAVKVELNFLSQISS